MMSHRSEFAWIGFEDSQRNIEALKEEVLKAEKKLKNVRKTFNCTVSSGKNDNQVSPNSFSFNQNWSKRKKMIQRSKKELHKVLKPQPKTSVKNAFDALEGEKVTFDKSDPSPSYEDQPKAYPTQSQDPKELKKRLIESAINNVMSRISSTENSTSSNSNLVKESSSDGTSTLITETYQNIDKKLKDVMNRCEIRKLSKASRISSALQSDEDVVNVEMSDYMNTEVQVVASSPMTQQPIKSVNGIEWRIPSAKNIHPYSASTSSANGFQKLKQIIDQQRKRHEQLLNSEVDDFAATNSKNQQTQTMNGEKPKINVLEQKVRDSENKDESPDGEEVQVKPPPVRKICTVATFPEYKGFSACGNMAASSGNLPPKKNVMYSHAKSVASPKRFRRIVKCSEDLGSASCWRKQWQSVPKVATRVSQGLVKQGKDEETSNSESSESDEQRVSEDMSVKETLQNTIDLTESPKKSVTDVLLDDNVTSETTSKHDLDSEEKENTSPVKKICKSSKRKAKMSFEQKCVYQKIRHYDVNKVRNYIEKKKAERKRRRLEETKKQKQEVENKKLQLQQLYEYQKRNINGAPRTRLLTPIKLPIGRASAQRVSHLYEIPKTVDTHPPIRAMPSRSDFNPTNFITPKETLEASLFTSSGNAKFFQKLSSPVREQCHTQLASDSVEQAMSVSTSEHRSNNSAPDHFYPVENETEAKVKFLGDSIEPLSTRLEEVATSSKGSVLSFLKGENASGSLTLNSSLNLSFSVNDAELQMVNLEKECGIIFRTEQSKTLKNLAQSVKSQVDDLTKQLEGFLRTKKWVEESSSPLKRKPGASGIAQAKILRTFRTSKIDFSDVLKLDESVKSFQERITGIGDTTALYSRITGKKYLAGTENEQEDTSKSDQEPIRHNEVDAVSIESSLTQHSLISSTERGKANFKDGDFLHSRFHSGKDESSGNGALGQSRESNELPIYRPDPFNFINTWNKKPLRIPQFSKDISTQEMSLQSSSPSLRPTSSQKTTSSKEEKVYSSDFEESDHINETVKHLTSHDLKSPASHKTAVVASSEETDSQTTSKVRHSTPVERGNTISDSLVVSSVYSYAVSDESTLKDNDLRSKVMSQSDSSISEIVSVVENSKDVTPEEKSSSPSFKDKKGDSDSGSNKLEKFVQKSRDSIAKFVHKSVDEALFNSKPESMQSDIQEDACSLKSTVPSDAKSIEEMLPSAHEISSVLSVGGASALTSPVESDFTKKTANKNSPVTSLNNASPVTSMREESPVMSANKPSPVSSVSEASSILFNEASPAASVAELSSCTTANSSEWEFSAPANIHISRKPDVATIVHDEKNVFDTKSDNVMEHFAENNGADPVRLQPSITFSGVANEDTYQMQRFGEFHQEQFIHPHIVARVATEAATAAATSAVIAVLETQKALLTKKQILAISERESNSPGQGSAVTHYSSDFESTNSQKSSSDPSRKSSGKSKPSIPDEAVSIASFNSLENSPLVEMAESTKVDGSLSHSKSSDRSLVHTEEIADDSQVGRHSRSKRKISGNLSSPSPASLSDNDSMFSATVVTSNTSISSLSHHSESLQSLNSDDAFAQLTLDVVRRMTYDEERRAGQQLSLLRFQENMLVENARAEMKWLELLKKKLREKGAERKVSAIKKRQKDLILRLRQERIQLRCMQEAYRSMCEKHRVLLADKKKFLNEPSSLAYQILHKKEKSLSGKRLSKESLKSGGQPQSASSSTPSIATDDEAYSINKMETTPEIPEVLELPKSMASNSSQESVIETQASGSTKSPQLSVSKSEAVSNVMPSVTNQEKVSSQSNQSMESALQGLKKLEASKRHLTKREQRIGQRRKHVESLLQWQMKLDSEEMAIRELEQRALELVDHSKKKAKYYVSSSISTTPNEKQATLTKPDLDNPEDIAIPTRGSNTSELVTTESLNNKPLSSESKQNSSIPEESLQSFVTLEGSVEEDIAMEKQNSNNLDVSSNAKSSTSTIAEEDINKGSESSIRTLEGSVQSPNGADIVSEEIPSVLSVSPKDKSSSDLYSESFESTVSNKTPSSSNKSSLQKNSGSQCGTKKNRNINIRLPLMPRNRRHDSSGSDDSYTISHSETASDQSDIEGRIHALAEELRGRKAEAEKLKRDHKRHYREQLKEKELSLQKQLEAYNQYIQQTRTELEHQLESAAAPTHGTDPSAGGGVKPQIKSPRIEHGGESRRLRKQSALSPPEALPLEKKAIDKSSNHDSPDSSILSNLSLTKGRAINFIKKAALESKDIPFSNKIQAPKDTSESNSNSNTASNIVTEISSQESHGTTEAIESSDTFVSESSKSKQETNATPKSDDSPKPDYPQNEADGSEDTTVSEKSMSSSISNKTLQNVSNYSPESESVVEEPLASNDGSVEEELESGNFECDGSDGCLTPPKQKPADQTFVIDESSVVLDHKQKLEENGFCMGLLYKSESLIDKTKLLGQKSEVFVTNVTCHLATSLLDDSIDVMLRVSGKCSMTLKAPTPVKPINTDVSPKAQAIFSAVENRMVKITNSILNKCLDEAIATIMNILNSTEKGLQQRQTRVSSEKLAHLNTNSLRRDEPPNGKIKSIFPADDHHKKHVKFAELSPIDDFIGSQAEFTKPNFSIVTGEAYTESLFNKQTDWFTEGFESNKEDSYLQQLEQQILLQQYPYYYRKIPNKPPPPYTPPSATEKSVSAKTGKQKSARLADGIASVKDNIDPIVENVVDVIIEGKIQGISIEDIAAPNVLPAAEVLQLTSPSQMTFMIFVFDLVKELVVDLFVEKEEELDPWVRPRKLTPKPLFTTNKTKMVSILQKEVQKLLKISPGYIQPEPRRNQSLRSAMKLGRKERDFVDTILISELKEEEPDWVNYDQDELTVKNQIAEAVLDHVMDDTVKVFLAMLKVNR